MEGAVSCGRTWSGWNNQQIDNVMLENMALCLSRTLSSLHLKSVEATLKKRSYWKFRCKEWTSRRPYCCFVMNNPSWGHWGKILKLVLTCFFYMCASLWLNVGETLSWSSKWAEPFHLGGRGHCTPIRLRVIDAMVRIQKASLPLASKPLTSVWKFLQYESRAEKATFNAMQTHTLEDEKGKTLNSFPWHYQRDLTICSRPHLNS